jgi:hypothetical protein
LTSEELNEAGSFRIVELRATTPASGLEFYKSIPETRSIITKGETCISGGEADPKIPGAAYIADYMVHRAAGKTSQTP